MPTSLVIIVSLPSGVIHQEPAPKGIAANLEVGNGQAPKPLRGEEFFRRQTPTLCACRLW
jgi:hypothetical protein